ncbi:TPA: DUF4393 domain-containing protein [Haemophilus influenzae]|uniref:DUF4393 domain-containing protein n=1 Tax=Haemophilus influenzae TaxID=727 RepID=UPI000DD335F9|nr:DUF4393 domain-containing protein [Haemophilus influenzae]MCK9000778.1 DUF4393 domain-containing protein [Haemophilus influenzae]MCK9071939.1 DUF4393 domain-containing protein [Haemophilus influenzae]MCK9075638.1 DUF4393 domain-containing protein [Haemophilus influenzae]RFO86023.1 DUF4393 domain-containing protein [Haemophilus influenzae]
MNELYPIVSGALSGLAAVGALKGPIESLTQIWTLTLGRFSDDAYQKYKIKQAANLQKYANEVKSGIEKIPEENIQEPKMSVVGPALEASKFYIEEDEIRGMFAKLIASSMDKTQSINIHPSFVEIIKVLSPLDAQNLYSLYHGGDETISKFRVTNKENGNYTDHFNHVFLGNPECQDNNLIESSIDNLIRLKLVDVSYSEYKSDDSLYDKHRENELFLKFKAEQEELQQHNTTLLNYLLNGGLLTDADTNVPLPASVQENYLNQLKKVVQEKEIEVVKGIIQLTAFGKNFCKVCL